MKLLIVFALTVTTVSSANLDFISQPGFPEGRIINGQPAAEGEAPYTLSLKSGSHFCGAILIKEDWALTAAHCLIYPIIQIVAGLHNRSNESNAQIRTAGKADQKAHRSYKGGVGPYDIGLIHIDPPFVLNDLVGTIKLPSGLYEETGKGKVCGWGYTNNSATLPDTLQCLIVDIIGYTACKAALPSSAPIHPTNICSYTAGTSDGACNGDSGGPLTHNTPNGTEVVGIVSWGYSPCTSSTYPSVYTRVFAYIEWIYNIINKFSD